MEIAEKESIAQAESIACDKGVAWSLGQACALEASLNRCDTMLKLLVP